MTEETDRQLQALFAETDEELPGDAFVDSVMTGVEQQVRLAKVRRFGIALAFVLCAFVLAAPLQGLVMVVMHGLTTPVVTVQDPLAAELLLPVNNAVTPLALAFFAWRMLHRRLFS
ncbi:hypothetical protein [Hoeflea sp.]|uniref:hypothetical protein n=1 Tax=Hoeflea sp. TaxID=1940281 RepID=UPI003B011401